MLAFRRVDRKLALVLLMLLFLVGQTLGALAPSYNVLMAARVVTAIALGAFFGIGAVIAMDAPAHSLRPNETIYRQSRNHPETDLGIPYTVGKQRGSIM